MIYRYSYPFLVGLVAVVNPCGFPLLPAYLTYFLGADLEGVAPPRRIVTAVRSAAAVSAGFVIVFTVLGTVLDLGVSVFMAWVPWVMIVLAVAMAAVGLYGLSGRHVDLHLPVLTLGGHSRSTRSMVGFGVSYAVGSLTCSLNLFLTVVIGSVGRAGLVSGAGTFVAYSLGMASILAVLSVAVAVARTSIVAVLRRGGRHLDRLSSGLLVAVAAYLAYYWITYLADPTTSTRPVAAVEGLQSSIVAHLGTSRGEATVAVVALVVVVAAAWSRWWPGRAAPAAPSDGAPTRVPAVRPATDEASW